MQGLQYNCRKYFDERKKIESYINIIFDYAKENQEILETITENLNRTKKRFCELGEKDKINKIKSFLFETDCANLDLIDNAKNIRKVICEEIVYYIYYCDKTKNLGNKKYEELFNIDKVNKHVFCYFINLYERINRFECKTQGEYYIRLGENRNLNIGSKYKVVIAIKYLIKKYYEWEKSK